MSNRNAGANTLAVVSEMDPYQQVESFSTFCDQMVQSIRTLAKEAQKKKGRKKKVPPVLTFPPRPSGRASILDGTFLFGHTMVQAGTLGILAPVPSEGETEPGESDTEHVPRDVFKKPALPLPTADTKTERPLRLRATQNTTYSRSGAQEEVERKRALPLPTADTRTERPSHSRVTRSTMSSRGRAQEEADQVPSRPVRNLALTFNVDEDNEPEPNENDTPRDVIKKPALPLPTADTRTERQSRLRATQNTTSSGGRAQEEAEQVPTRPVRNRTFKVDHDTEPGPSKCQKKESGDAADKQRQLESVEQEPSSEVQPNDPGARVLPTRSKGHGLLTVPVEEPQPGSSKRHNEESADGPADKRVKSSDKPISAKVPGLAAVAVEGKIKRRSEESDDGPAVKRVKSAEELSLKILQNDTDARAPRTRSKARALAAAPLETSQSGAANKENSLALPINQIMKGLTLDKSNRTPGKTASKTVNTKSPKKDKHDAFFKKEADAFKKKQELMNQKKEEIRKNRETKVKKVAESRAAVEKEKLLQLEKEKKEREEKERLALAELQRQKKEEILKKKLLNQQKAQEAEERRVREERIRLARLKEQEEEQRRAAEARQRQLEEAERLAALRKAQEKEEEQLRALEKEKREREKGRVVRAVPTKEDPDDIGIDEADGDETAPRRPCANWAEEGELRAALCKQFFSISGGIEMQTFFEGAPSTPNLKKIFGNDAMLRPRTSSQFWPKTPPKSLQESSSAE